ncbi:MAG: hypothetical protein ABSE43_15860 [Steroidobacteraceae bacterium]
MRFKVFALRSSVSRTLLVGTFWAALSGCNSSTVGTTITGVAGDASEIAITTNTGSTTVLADGVLLLAATVENDPTNAGVKWALTPSSGYGTLSEQTNYEVLFTAPPNTFVGTITPVITATSIANPVYYANAVLVVDGRPVIPPITLFPAYVGEPYGATIHVDGGEAPFTWTRVDTASLPAGLSLTTTTSSYVTITGTPTVATQVGQPVLLQFEVTDSIPLTATSGYIALTVNPTTKCILGSPPAAGNVSTQYAFLETGFLEGKSDTRIGSLNFTPEGGATGIVEARFATTSFVGSAAQTVTGNCTDRELNNGRIVLTGYGTPTYSYAVTNSFSDGLLQLTSGSDAETGEGPLLQQDVSAFTPATFAGATFEFGLYGTNSGGDHIGLIGQMSFDSFAATATGLMDSNDPALPQSAVPLTVTAITKPDPVTGRGTMNVSAGTLNLTLVYYIVNSNKLLIMDDDTTSSVPRVAGYLTRQGYLTGAAPPFTNEALGASSPAVFSLTGIAGTTLPTAVLGLGRLSGAWPASPGDTLNGTLNVALDEAIQAQDVIGEFFPGAPYSVAANGRAVLSFVDTLSTPATTRQFVIYLDDISDGYIIENGSSTGNAGQVFAQVQQPYPSTIDGAYIGGSPFQPSAGPLSLLPQTELTGGVVGSEYANGQFAINTTTGRGFGTFAVTGDQSLLSTDYAVMYLLQNNPVGGGRFILIRMGSRYKNGGLVLFED